MSEAARAVHEQTGKSAGNGSLMRTVPVALAHLDDPDAVVEAALKVSALTHNDPMAGEACALWCLMLRHAILDGAWPSPVVDEQALRALVLEDARDEPPRRARNHWPSTFTEAEGRDPSAFTENAWVVGAMGASWSAITHTDVPTDEPGRHLQVALARAIENAHDTDTVGAIAGGMLGARWGAAAVPDGWVQKLHGWRDQTGAGLAVLAERTVAA
jgi:ADP-ribosylglycohydrolase